MRLTLTTPSSSWRARWFCVFTTVCATVGTLVFLIQPAVAQFANAPADFDSLIEEITSTIAPDPWQNLSTGRRIRKEGPATTAIERTLRRAIRFEPQCDTLKELATLLRRQGLTIRIDKRPLEDWGVGLTDQLPNVLESPQRMRIKDAIRYLGGDDITYVVRGNACVLTSIEEMELRLETTIYDLDAFPSPTSIRH